jgi:phage shock protein PspC (stress-responsive transcriptional regulator)
MNEIHHIHLGRQAYTVSADAYKELRDYLEAIQKKVGKEVAEEVELRMSELLTERGVTGKKVVLQKDVDYLKAQLGAPGDFSDDSSDETEAEEPEEAPKRLFRDSDNAMIAGVAAGLANYFGIDVIIVRLLFIALTFFGGSGVLVYVILWLLVPEAKTNSERLQMQGMQVNVDNIKRVVDQADVPGATRRVANVVGGVAEEIAKLFLGFVGIVLTTVGSVGLLAALTSAVYLLTGHGELNGEKFLPVGTTETWMVVAAAASVAILFLTLILVGIAMVRRKWQTPGWGVAALFGLFFVTAPIAGALIAGSVPDIRHRFEALHKTQTVSVAAFKNVDLTGHDTRFSYVPDSKYFLEYQYIGGKHITGSIRASVQGDTLHVNTDKFMDQHTCDGFCIYSGPDLQVIIHAPELDKVGVHGSEANFFSNDQLKQSGLVLDVDGDSRANVQYARAAKAVLQANGSGTRHLELTLDAQSAQFEGVGFDEEGGVSFMDVQELDLTTARKCEPGEGFVFAQPAPTKLLVNGTATTPTPIKSFEATRNNDSAGAANCVQL